MNCELDKITVIVNGRFHAFDYAAELAKQNLLDRLISSMPYKIARKYGIERNHYIGLPIFEVLKRVWRIIFKREFSPILYSKIFTQTALLFIKKDTKYVICNAGCCKEIFESKKLKNSVKVLDRGSSHTYANIDANRMAAKYHNIKWVQNSSAFVDRELLEYKLADRILVPSDYVEQTFLEKGYRREKILKIPFAFSFTKFEGIPRKKMERELVVLFVGQVNHLKGIGVLINAMSIVHIEYPKAKLWIVGPKNSLISKLIFKQEWIEYFGILKGQDLVEKYLKASVFCLPTYDEGLAIVLLEAKNFGLPIITTFNSGASQLIRNGEDGFIIPVGDHEILAKKIKEILENKEYFLQQAKFNIDMQEMTWEKYSDLLVNHLYKL